MKESVPLSGLDATRASAASVPVFVHVNVPSVWISVPTPATMGLSLPRAIGALIINHPVMTVWADHHERDAVCSLQKMFSEMTAMHIFGVKHCSRRKVF